MTATPINTLRAALVFIHLFRLSLSAATIRASFLTEGVALRDTLDILRSSGCKDDATVAFQQAVARYASTAFDFDFSKFPRPCEGFYSFESASSLIAALPHQLCDTRHAYEFNCLDTVIALAGGSLRINLRPDDSAGPFLVPYTQTNGSFTVLPRATARDAFMLAYPPWYRDVTDTALPQTIRDARISLTAALFGCHMLPQSTTEEGLRDRVTDVLRSSWRRHGMKFPAKFEVVLCHEVSFSQLFFVTAHAGLLFPRKHGYTYIEKSGGGGPFVRIDFEDRVDLLSWLGSVFRGAEKFGYTHCFATFNDEKIEVLEFLK